MEIHEYQAKAILADYGVAIPKGGLASRADRLVDLRESYRAQVIESTRSQAVALVDSLFANPIIAAHRVEKLLGVKRPTSLRLLDRLRELEILTEMAPGPRRQRRFMAAEILHVLEEDHSHAPHVP